MQLNKTLRIHKTHYVFVGLSLKKARKHDLTTTKDPIAAPKASCPIYREQ